MLSGEAGIGKSRLMAELKKRDVMRRVTCLEGRAISIGRNLSFHPIINLFKHWAQIVEDDSEAQAIAKLKLAIRSRPPRGDRRNTALCGHAHGHETVGEVCGAGRGHRR